MKRRNIWEGEEEWVSSELQKELQILEAFCSDIHVWQLLGTNNPECKAKPLLSAVTQGAWQAPEAMTDTWASTSLASYQLHNQVFNPTISPCLVKQEKRWTASNLWQYARRIADIGSWCILMPLLLVIMTAYSSRFLNHGKLRTCIFYNSPVSEAFQIS